MKLYKNKYIILPDEIIDVEDVPSIHYHKRYIAIYKTYISSYKYNDYEIFVSNVSLEEGGHKTSFFLGKNKMNKIKLDYIYRGKIPTNEQLFENNRLNLNANILFDNSDFAYGKTIDFDKELFSQCMQDVRNGDFPRYTFNDEKIYTPGPEFYTESHRIVSGFERDDFERIMMEDSIDYIIPLKSLIDKNTTIKLFNIQLNEIVDASLLDPIVMKKYQSFLDILHTIVAITQYVAFIMFIDKLLIQYDSNIGFWINEYKSTLNPLTEKSIKNDYTTFILSLLEDNSITVKENIFIENCRIFVYIDKFIISVRVYDKQSQNLKKPVINYNYSKSDCILYELQDIITQ